MYSPLALTHDRRRRGAPARRVVLIPAHDEEADIADAVRSALALDPSPERVLVVADNCSDRTAEAALAAGAEVMLTRDNRGKKAGALNQAWRRVRPTLEPGDLVLAMDADTTLAPNFLAAAEWHLRADPTLAGVCASFHGRSRVASGSWSRVLGLLQRMEYARYQRSIARRRFVTTVLSGTATAFRVATLDALERDRGFVWHEESMLEDYELSLAFRHRGMRCIAPEECCSYTDVMPTIGRLWQQRIRWQRGTIEELRRYGLNRVTAVDVGRQALLAGAVLARVLLVVAVAATIALAGGLHINPYWTSLGSIVAFERFWSMRELGTAASLVALVVVVEELYGVFREAFWCRSLWLALRRSEWRWHAT